jgi:hypothetical protein
MTGTNGPGDSLPVLRIVPVETLVPHEQHDDTRAGPLIQKMRENGVLKNPPIVAPLSDDTSDHRYVVLDGANRSTAARVAGLPHMLVQIVRYEDPGIRLSVWHHALVGVRKGDIERALEALPGLVSRGDELRHARAVLARREALAYLVHAGGQTFTLHGPGDLHQRNALLNAVVDTYRDRTRFHRVAGDSLDEARQRYPDTTALVVFPRFEPAEILELAGTGARLPAGITRHLIPWRALHVNVPLELLGDPGRSLDEKNRWLTDWLSGRVAQRHVRFYEESTVLFDE